MRLSTSRLLKKCYSCFDWLSTNGKSSTILTSDPFALSLSKGERRVFQHPARAQPKKREVKRPELRHQLRHALGEFFTRRFATSGGTEVKVVDDLILLRCKEALSSSEVDLGSMKSGRLLLQEVSERTCQELKPELDRLLYRVTGLRLVDLCVGLFFDRREKIYLFTMSDAVKQRAQRISIDK